MSYKINGNSILSNTNLTGTPTAPTPSDNTTTTRIATTGYVNSLGFIKTTPDIDASKITSGTFDINRIPIIPNSKLSTFTSSQIPGIDASILVAGTIPAARYSYNDVIINSGYSGNSANRVIVTSMGMTVPNSGAWYLGFSTYNSVTNKGYAYGISIWGSDINLKENISEPKITNASSYIKKIEFKSFKFIDSNNYVDLGVIAQQIEKIYPGFVFQPGEYKQIQSETLITFILKATQELITDNEKLNNEIEILKNDMELLKNDMELLKNEIKLIKSANK